MFHTIKIAKIQFTKETGNEIISTISNINNWNIPNDFHVTYTFMHKNGITNDKLNTIKVFESLILNKKNKIMVDFDGIYKSNGNIFTKVNKTDVYIPKPCDQILHMTLFVDTENDFKPKDSLISLQKDNYTKISDFKKGYIGELVIETI